MQRLVVVSNRVTPVTGRQPSQAGGLTVGVHAALQNTGGIWFGWSGETRTDATETAKMVKSRKVTYGLMDLQPAEFEAYYGGFSNRTLWPLFHYRIDLTSFEHPWYAAYRRVNEKFARALRPHLLPDDMIWIHDYHLIPLAAELRKLGVKSPIGFFLHIPFPSLDIYTALPWHRQLAQDLCHCNVVGFQTRRDADHFEHYLKTELGANYLQKDVCTLGERKVRTGAYPIGIDVEQFYSMARTAEAKRSAQAVKATLPWSRKLMVGVDRLDYTKGIIERLRAFELLLRDYPAVRRKVVLMQISAPSRIDVPEYLDMRQQVEAKSGHINGLYSEADWVPLRYINRSFSRRVLGGFFELSKIGIVTPLRDGMNLVAEEYVAAQNRDDPGVLILSRFAGCAHILDGSLIINPYDVHHTAASIYEALIMPLEERKERWERMYQACIANDIYKWRDRFLGDLEQSWNTEPAATHEGELQ